MSGRTDSGTDPVIAEADERADDADDAYDLDGHDLSEARRARWTAAGAGGLLTLAGLAAALLRLTGSAPALVSAAYALGAAVCACAAFLGFRGRTRRALWLLIAGTMVMALGDQFD
jgi:drug/metabolite transporter (DMT)-like permease